MNRNHRGARRIVGALGCGALVALALAGTAAASPQRTHSFTAPRGATHSSMAVLKRERAMGLQGQIKYAVAKPVCAAASAAMHYSCFAIKRVPASKGTAGSFAYLATPGKGPAGGYTPNQLASAYGFNPAAKVHQTVGIVDWYDDPHALSDLDHFDSYYHLPKETSTSFRKVEMRGPGKKLPKPDKDTSGEITLDIQAVRGACHSCRIVLIEAYQPSDADLAAAENEAVKLGATEVSNSFGEPEKYLTKDKNVTSILNAYYHPGVVITASTGDDGWFAWDNINKGIQSPGYAEFPASDNTVVSVGGTELAINRTSGKRTAEAVWNENGPVDEYGQEYKTALGATGSGCSAYFYAPPWQSSNPGYADSYCTQGGHDFRLSADVSAIADPALGFDIYQTYGGKGWETIGGTSLASPLTAAMWALAGGAKGAAYPAAALYLNAHYHPGSVFDVVPYNDESEGIADGNSICGGVDPDTCDSDFKGNPNGFVFQNSTTPIGLVDCSLPRDGSAPTSDTESTECNVATGLDGPTGLGTPRSLQLFRATTPTLTLSGSGTDKKGRSASYRAIAKEIVPNTKISYYEISWGDGSNVAKNGTGRFSHRYSALGSHTITVAVVDSRYQETIEHYRVKVVR